MTDEEGNSAASPPLHRSEKEMKVESKSSIELKPLPDVKFMQNLDDSEAPLAYVDELAEANESTPMLPKNSFQIA